METKDVRIGQIVTVYGDSKTLYKIEKLLEGGKAYLFNIQTGLHREVKIIELSIEFNS